MHYDILDEKRQALLPLFAPLKETFYLAGGTALALQIGHRDSIDFDFFTHAPVDTSALFERLRDLFAGHTLLKTQEEKKTRFHCFSTIRCALAFLPTRARC